MRAEHIRLYKAVHTWTGILSGMALFIAFYAGALTVFKEPLARWASPPSATTLLPLSNAQKLIVRTLAADPSVAKDFTIRLDDHEHVLGRMNWHRRPDTTDDHDESSVRHFVATLDTTGAAQIAETYPSTLGNFIDVLHRVVGLPFDNDPSRWFMGVIAALYAIALISGVIVLLPSLIKDFFALRIGKNLKRMWLDAHNVVGIISLPFHVVMALSAVVFAFHDQIYFIQDKVVHDGKLATTLQRPQVDPNIPPTHDPAAMLAPLALINTVQALSPNFQPISLRYTQVTGPHPQVQIWGKDDTEVLPRALGGFIAIDPYSGKVLNTDYMPGKQIVAHLFLSSFFALHMASFGNIAVQWMYFLLGLAGAWLFYSGNLIWIESRRRRMTRRDHSAPTQRLDTRILAALTIGVCLGSVCGISAMIVASKWLHGYVADLASSLAIVYYAVFFGCIAWSLMKGAAYAAVHLPWLAAGLTLTIPLTSVLGWLSVGNGLWANTSGAAIGVDLVSTIGALCLAGIGFAALRRTRQGAADSVWSQTLPSDQQAPSGQQIA